MRRFGAMTGRTYHLFDYEGDADADRVMILMGSGAETAPRRRPPPCVNRARRSACCRCAFTGRSPSPICWRLCPPRCAASPCWTARRSRAGIGEPLFLGRRRGPGRCRGHGRAGGDAAHHRRPLRPVLEGFHPGHGQGRLRRVAGRQTPERLHARHHRRRDPIPACRSTPASWSRSRA